MKIILKYNSDNDLILISLFSAMSRVAVFISLLVLFSCGSGEEDPGPINSNFLDNVRYLKLEIADYPEDPVLIANGINSVKFTLLQFDKDRKFLFKNLPSATVIKVNGQTDLKAPFVFKTTQPGIYTFDIPGIPADRFIEPAVELKVIAPKEYPEITMPVIFHFIASPSAFVNNAYLRDLINFHLAEMNKAYSNGDGSTDPSVVSAAIRFVAAEMDPEGNSLEIPGLHLIRSEKFKFKNSEDKDLHNLIWDGNFWPPREMINVWVSDFEEEFSWARFPFLGNSNSDFPTSAFGVFFKESMFTETRINSVMIHESGHLLNLYHNFTSVCNGDVDECSDTYEYRREFDKPFAGGITRTSCEDFQFTSNNYMDYYPSMFNTFTFQQRERMRRTIDLCPFLPTPRNSARKTKGTRSNLQMPFEVDPGTLIR
jgi:hypothetical protein